MIQLSSVLLLFRLIFLPPLLKPFFLAFQIGFLLERSA
jgi:hypothetical protein